jgi:hypothetical protein
MTLMAKLAPFLPGDAVKKGMSQTQSKKNFYSFLSFIRSYIY